VVAYAIEDHSFRLYPEEENFFSLKINKISYIIDIICNVFFIIEFLINIIVMGFAFG
jgi:hypothetical protein